ncbi:MAG: hypothetical protein R3B47_06035 [Bacteroidia bacterium]
MNHCFSLIRITSTRELFSIRAIPNWSSPRLLFPRVHFAFLDGAHTYEYVLQEYAHIRDRQRPGDVIVFDDYTPAAFPGIVKAVDEICEREGYDKKVFSISDQRGYVVARKV